MQSKPSADASFNLYLYSPHQFSDYSVHECLYESLIKFKQQKILNFVPPSGQTSLFYYKYRDSFRLSPKDGV